MRKTLLPVLAAAAILSLLAGCGGGDDKPKKGEFVIGSAVPLSGDLAALGKSGEKSSELALQEIRKAIATAGLRGTVSLETADTGADESSTVDAVRQLADKGARCIAGPWTSGATAKTAQSVTAEKRLLTISPAATADFIGTLGDRGLVNRTVLKDSDQGVAIANGLALGLRGGKGKVVNVAVRGDDYGNGIAESFARTWTARGGTVGERVTVAPGRSDYSAEAKRITSGRPDAVVIIDRADSFKQLGRDLAKTKGWDPSKAWGTDGLASSSLLQDPGPKAVRGMRITVPGAGADPAGKAFKDRSKDEQTFSAQQFDAVVLCYLAYVAAKSTDGHRMAAKLPALTAPGGRKYSWQQLPKAIEALRAGQDIDYVGASGGIDLDKTGNATSGAYDLYTLGGKLELSGSIPVVIND